MGLLVLNLTPVHLLLAVHHLGLTVILEASLRQGTDVTLVLLDVLVVVQLARLVLVEELLLLLGH